MLFSFKEKINFCFLLLTFILTHVIYSFFIFHESTTGIPNPQLNLSMSNTWGAFDLYYPTYGFSMAQRLIPG